MLFFFSVWGGGGGGGGGGGSLLGMGLVFYIILVRGCYQILFSIRKGWNWSILFDKKCTCACFSLLSDTSWRNVPRHFYPFVSWENLLCIHFPVLSLSTSLPTEVNTEFSVSLPHGNVCNFLKANNNLFKFMVYTLAIFKSSVTNEQVNCWLSLNNLFLTQTFLWSRCLSCHFVFRATSS